MQISRENGKSKCLFYITKEKHERKKNPVKKIILFYRYEKNLKKKKSNKILKILF
jgi:hypothetical protein